MLVRLKDIAEELGVSIVTVSKLSATAPTLQKKLEQEFWKGKTLLQPT